MKASVTERVKGAALVLACCAGDRCDPAAAAGRCRACRRGTLVHDVIELHLFTPGTTVTAEAHTPPVLSVRGGCSERVRPQ